MDRLKIQFVDGGGHVKAATLVEFAETPGDRRVGLSTRPDMGGVGGMLFDKVGMYWMKDVNFPLDILFLDKYGGVVEKCHMPMDKAGKHLYAPTTLKSAHVLELPAGWFDGAGLKVGDRIQVTAIIDSGEKV